MKKFLQFLPLLVIPVAFILMSYSSGAPDGRTGSPGDGGLSCTQCHSSFSPINVNNWITTDIPAEGYTPGEIYNITATGIHSGVVKFGFEITAEDAAGNKIGTLSILNPTETQHTASFNAITHTSAGITPTGDTKSWTVEWTAPDDPAGDITFYAAFNAANGNGTSTGDQIYLSSTTVSEVAGGASDLFFSEYSEGSSNNKYLEIFNGTGTAVDLSVYAVKTANNGGAWGSYVENLSGTLVDGDVFVIANASADATIINASDITSTVTFYNGDDAVGLFKNDVLIDVIGIQGEDPGSYWPVAGVSDGTKEHTLVRKPDVCSPTTDWAASAGTNADDSQWVVYPQDYWENIGYHISNCGGTVEPEPSNHPTNFAASANGTDITLSWTDATGTQLPDAYLIKASTSSAIAPPTDGTFVLDDLDFSDGNGAANVPFGQEAYVFSSLPYNTEFFFEIYAYTNSGPDVNYKTDGTIPAANATTQTLPTVSTLAELRAGTLGEEYILTGEVILTYQQAWRNQKFVQDATAAILIDDNAGIITSDYEIGDGITGIQGVLNEYGNMLQFAPTADPGTPTSAGNIITPEVVTIAQLYADFESYESELIKIEAALFANTGVNFQEGTVYEINDNSDATGYFRTTFYDADYLYTPIPAGEVNLTGIPNSRFDGDYFTSRFSEDIVPLVQEPTIIVTSPDGFEQWAQESTYNITWQNIDFSGNVTITLLKGAFGTPTTLASNIVNTGTWAWTIPATQTPASDYKVRVKGVNPGDPQDESNEYFTIIEPQPIPDIVINEIMYNPSTSLGNDDDYEYLELYNNSGFDVDMSNWYFSQGIEFTFPAGTTFTDGTYMVIAKNADTIQQYYGISGVLQWISGNLGNSGETVELNYFDGSSMDIVPYDDEAPWPTEPDGSGPSLELLDIALDNSLPESWAASIVDNGTPGAVNSVVGAEVLTVTYPNGGETIEQGSSQTITWDYFGFSGLIKIELITGTKNREVLAENIPVTDGLWDWEVPADQPVGNNYKIKISDMDDGMPMDESDGMFSIVEIIIPTITVLEPNGGESWAQGTTHTISWTSEFFSGDVKIELSDGTKVITLIEDSIPVAQGSYAWAIPADQPTGSNYTVIVSAMETGIPTDESDAPFSIIEPAPVPDLVINEIMYNSPGDDNEWIEIYNNEAFTIDLEGFYILDADDLHTPVVFPAGYSIAPGQYFTVSLELLAPPLPFTPDFVGDASWSLGNSGDDVRIFDPNGQLVDIVSYADGTPWPSEPDGSGPTLSLLVPTLDNSLPESWAASLGDGGTPGAENFPTGPTITVVSPNGGETIQQGATFNISWTWAEFDGYVMIELLTPAKAINSVIADNIPVTDGSYDWLVTEAVGDGYIIRISDVEDGDPMDESDGTFSIVPAAELPDVVINEIMYNPPESGTDSLEYIELYNNGDVAVNLLGWYFLEGVDFTFPDYELAAGEFVVVAVNADAMFNTFGVVALQWTSGGLSNGGEDIDLRNNSGEQIDYVNYSDGGEWPAAADGFGPSIGLTDPSIDNSLGASWMAETQNTVLNAEGYPIYASPGTVNFLLPAQGILISGGWTGISSYASPTNPSIEPMMDLIVNDLTVMQDFSSIYFPLYNVNTIVNWNTEKGYQLKMVNPRYHVIYGSMVTDKTVDLNTGWNSLPVLSECPVDAAALFGGLSELIFVKEMGSDKIYWPGGGIFTLDFLMPGNAYFIKVSANVSVTFPDCTAKFSIPQVQPEVQPETAWNPVIPTGASHAIGFDASAFESLLEGDLIVALTGNGYCAGMAEVSGKNAAMMVWGDDVYTTTTDGFAEDENISFAIYRPSTGETFDVTAVYDLAYADAGEFTTHGISFVTELKTGATGIDEQVEASFNIYPNPAADVININSTSVVNADVEIYSSLGQKVYSGEIAGSKATIDVSKLNKGYYFIKFVNRNSGIQETLSFIKK